jgi:hypothetical protein
MVADVDIGQVIFVIVFLVVAFIQWLIKLIKEKAEAATRSQQMPSEEEAEARRRAWQEQTRPVEPASTPHQRPSGGGLGDLLGEVRKAIEQAVEPKAPPPLPRPPVVVSAAPKPLAPTPATIPAAMTAADRAMVLAPIQSLLIKKQPHPLTRLLYTPEGYRQAFVLREVLGPPRALQEYRGPED